MDILGPFQLAKGRVKFLLVAIHYFTKWIEVEPIATISARQVKNFIWKKCRLLTWAASQYSHRQR